MKKHNCERCIHFEDSWLYMDSITGICSKRNKVVNKCGFPCKWYEQLKWWQRIYRKLVRK